MKALLSDLWVVTSTGFMLELSCDSHYYTDRDEAEKEARERQQRNPNLIFKVYDLDHYIDEIRCRCH